MTHLNGLRSQFSEFIFTWFNRLTQIIKICSLLCWGVPLGNFYTDEVGWPPVILIGHLNFIHAQPKSLPSVCVVVDSNDDYRSFPEYEYWILPTIRYSCLSFQLVKHSRSTLFGDFGLRQQPKLLCTRHSLDYWW